LILFLRFFQCDSFFNRSTNIHNASSNWKIFQLLEVLWILVLRLKNASHWKKRRN